MRDFREQDFYELLDVNPHSSQQELERAYDRARRFFSPDSVATYALFQPDELTLLRRRIEEAYRILSDHQRRAGYDQELARLDSGWLDAAKAASIPEEPGDEDGKDTPEPESATADPATEEPATEVPATEVLATDEPATEVPATDEPATEDPAADEALTAEPACPCPDDAPVEMPQIDEETEITGALLLQARLAKGLSLDDYVNVTKISIYYLRNIENEVFNDLPAVVYVRGYLRQMAKILGLDPPRVSESYLDRMAKLTSEQDG
jgi:cytoskeletal protein RodZ